MLTPDGLRLDNRQGFLCLKEDDHEANRKNLIKGTISYTIKDIINSFFK